VSGYLEKCSVTRMIASGGLFLSIPIFLLGMSVEIHCRIACTIAALTNERQYFFWNYMNNYGMGKRICSADAVHAIHQWKCYWRGQYCLCMLVNIKGQLALVKISCLKNIAVLSTRYFVSRFSLISSSKLINGFVKWSVWLWNTAKLYWYNGPSFGCVRVCVCVCLALMLYAILEYTLTSAITCVVIFTVAIVYITITAAHSIHCWNVQKSRTSNSVESTSTVKSPSLVLPLAVSKQTLNSDDSALSQVKLSTLV